MAPRQMVKAGTPPEAAIDEPIDVRDGDTLVVSYPEVTIPIAQYSVVKVGGLTYTRQLRVGDDVAHEHDRIYNFLRQRVETEARVKCAHFVGELQRARERR